MSLFFFIIPKSHKSSLVFARLVKIFDIRNRKNKTYKSILFVYYINYTIKNCLNQAKKDMVLLQFFDFCVLTDKIAFFVLPKSALAATFFDFWFKGTNRSES